MTKTNKALKKLGLVLNGVEPEGEHTWEILDSMAEGEALALTVTPATDSDDTFDKQASDLQENILVGENAITGTLKYVTGYLAYTGDEQNGNFLALKAVANKDGCSITAELVGGLHGRVTLESDGIVIFRVTNTEQYVRFVVTKGGKSKAYSYSLSDLVLGQPVTETATLTYALSIYSDSHDEDKLPSPVTVPVGTQVNVDFSTYPAPSSEGYDFVGWATTDGDSSPDYSEGGTETITMQGDVTLYPVYAVHIATDYLAIDNTYGAATILVEWYDEDKGQWKTSKDVSSGDYQDFEYTIGREYRITFGDDTQHPINFTGVLDGSSYVNESVGGQDGQIIAPDGKSWIFGGGVCYLVSVQEQAITNKLVIDNTNGGVEVVAGYMDDPNPVLVPAGGTEDFVFNADETFYVSFGATPSTADASFTGTIGGSSYTNETLSIDTEYGTNGISSPNGDWSFASGEGGTLTITSTDANA